MTDGKLTVGQEVRVFTSQHRYNKTPGGGLRGTVIRVGRTLCDVQWDGREPVKFEMSNGRAQYGAGGYYLLTVEQVRERDRRTSAVGVLSQYGFTVATYADVTADQLEAMAAILRPDHKPETTENDR